MVFLGSSESDSVYWIQESRTVTSARAALSFQILHLTPASEPFLRRLCSFSLKVSFMVKKSSQRAGKSLRTRGDFPSVPGGHGEEIDSRSAARRPGRSHAFTFFEECFKFLQYSLEALRLQTVIPSRVPESGRHQFTMTNRKLNYVPAKALYGFIFSTTTKPFVTRCLELS